MENQLWEQGNAFKELSHWKTMEECVVLFGYVPRKTQALLVKTAGRTWALVLDIHCIFWKKECVWMHVPTDARVCAQYYVCVSPCCCQRAWDCFRNKPEERKTERSEAYVVSPMRISSLAEICRAALVGGVGLKKIKPRDVFFCHYVMFFSFRHVHSKCLFLNFSSRQVGPRHTAL